MRTLKSSVLFVLASTAGLILPSRGQVEAQTTARTSSPTTAPATGLLPSAARMQWMLDTTVGAYDAAGNKDPKWDAMARRTLEAACRTWGKSARRNGDEDETVIQSSGAAIGAGCRDPMVIYARARTLGFYGRKPSEVAECQKGMVESLRASKYPPIRKCYGLLRAGEVDAEVAPSDDRVHAASHAMLEEAMRLLPDVYADPRIPAEEVAGSLEVIGDASEAVEGDRALLRDRAIEVMRKSPLSEATMLTARGETAVYDGRRARGGEFADKVNAQQWRALELSISDAHNLLRKSWQLDPTIVETAVFELYCETQESHGRAAMEHWFRLANQLDPDDQRPYEAKLGWLEPKWHGSAQETLKFGRECAATQRWSGLVPLVLVEAHWCIACYGPDGYSAIPLRSYFANNPGAWAEIKPICDRYLQEPDVSNFHRTRFAVIAAWSGKWRDANTLFRSITAGRPHPGVLFDNAGMDTLVKEAATESHKQSEEAATHLAARVAAGTLKANDCIVSARWGGGDKWVDVTTRVKQWIALGDEVWADNESLGSDPTPGWRKTLEAIYKKNGKQQTLRIDEDQKVPTAELRP